MKQPEKQTDTQILENGILGLCAFTDHPPLHGLSKLKELDVQLCHEDRRVLQELNWALSPCCIIHDHYRFDEGWDY